MPLEVLHDNCLQTLVPDLNTQTSLLASTLCRTGHCAFSETDMIVNVYKHVQHG